MKPMKNNATDTPAKPPGNKKIRRYLIILPVILIAVGYVMFNQITRRHMQVQIESTSALFEAGLKDLVLEPLSKLAENDAASIETIMKRVTTNPYILYAVLRKEGRTLYRFSRLNNPIPPRPVSSEGQPPFARLIETGGRDILVLDTSTGKEIPGLLSLEIGIDNNAFTALRESNNRTIAKRVFTLVFMYIAVVLLFRYFDRKNLKKEQEIEKEKREKERFKELSLLTSEIAHEIKNPLNSIYLSFKTLEKHITITPGKEEKAAFYKESITNEIQRVSDIIGAYSQLSREPSPHIETVDINKLAGEFRFLVEKELNERDVVLDIAISAPLTVNTDPNFLKQVLHNLVGNSAEAGAKTVTIECAVKDKELRIIVTDDGHGIDPEVREKVFRPYFSTKTRGMGLGLHITLRLIKSLGGSLELGSTSDSGTVFKVRLPEQPPSRKK